MTRESRARWLALATAVTVVALSALFAALRNLTPSPAQQQPATTAPAAGRADAARIAAGRAAFERLNCALCHAVADQGNPSHSLDGVGARRSRDALRAWAFGGDAAAAQLPPGIAQIKQRAAEDADVEALLDYLQQLR